MKEIIYIYIYISVKALLLRYLQRYRGSSSLLPQNIMLFAGMVAAWLWWVRCYSRQAMLVPREREYRAITPLEVRRPARPMALAPYRSRSPRH